MAYNEELMRARTMINQGYYRDAYNFLQNVSNTSAEWFYLTGISALQIGYHDQGEDYIKRAKFMEPGNMEYESAFRNLSRGSESYNYRSRQYNNQRPLDNSGCCGNGCCDILCKLWCADSCCECLGGDLIACC